MENIEKTALSEHLSGSAVLFLCIAQGNREKEDGTLPGFGAYPHFLMQTFHDFIGNGKTQTASGGIVHGGFIKAFKNMRQILCADALTIIGDAYQHGFSVQTEPCSDMASAAGEPDRVRQEIAE